jgi:opacity protein-like surface antigen
MKKFALAAVAVALSAGAAFAENPRVGEPADLYANDHTPVATQQVDNTATASIGQSAFQDGSAHRFGDASPSSFQN